MTREEGRVFQGDAGRTLRVWNTEQAEYPSIVLTTSLAGDKRPHRRTITVDAETAMELARELQMLARMS